MRATFSCPVKSRDADDFYERVMNLRQPAMQAQQWDANALIKRDVMQCEECKDAKDGMNGCALRERIRDGRKSNERQRGDEKKRARRRWRAKENPLSCRLAEVLRDLSR